MPHLVGQLRWSGLSDAWWREAENYGMPHRIYTDEYPNITRVRKVIKLLHSVHRKDREVAVILEVSQLKDYIEQLTSDLKSIHTL
jgi:hypothetical protein